MIYVAIGTNLPHPEFGSPLEIANAAAQIIDANDLSVIGRSGWYRSAPIPASNQPDFVNGVIAVETALSPTDLLARLHRIEDRFGRVRSEANAARTLDIDLLDYGGMVLAPGRDGTGPILPHPRLQDRAFVLFPLREIAPDWRDPRDGRSIASLIAALPPGQLCEPIQA